MKRILVILSFMAFLAIPMAAQATSVSQGYHQALASGMKITPGAKREMLNAPLGSCINDPLQSKCQKPGALFYHSKGFYLETEHPSWAPVTQTGPFLLKRHCAVDNHTFTKELAGGTIHHAYWSAYVESSVTCYHVAIFGAFDSLFMFRLDINHWQHMASGPEHNAGNAQTIRPYASKHCESQTKREWGMQAYFAYQAPNHEYTEGGHKGRSRNLTCWNSYRG